ncbi:MAG: C4-type zinc ribbon domain-containing protein [Candidatus Omnitrophota bacterium]
MFDICARKEAIPARIQEMDKSLDEKGNATLVAEDALKKLQVRKNEKETDIKAKEEAINKHQAQLYAIKNNKEYTALQNEIDSIKADISLLEEEIINLFDEIETAQAKREEEKRTLDEEEQKVETEKTAIKAEGEQLSKQLDGFNAERTALAGNVDTTVLKQYERIRENRGRLAIVPVKGDLCGACNMLLRPQIINETRIGKNIVYCENCARILYAAD